MADLAALASEEVALAEHIVSQVCGRGSGRLEDECLANQPRDRYFIGSLRPREDSEEDLQRRVDAELLNKLAPSAVGLEIRLQPTGPEMRLMVELEWSCYYRIWPTYEQQVQHQAQARRNAMPAEHPSAAGSRAATDRESSDDGDADDSDDVQPIGSPDEATADIDEISPESQGAVVEAGRRRGQSSDSLFVRFGKVQCRAAGAVVLARSAEGLWAADHGELQAAIEDETARAVSVLLGDADHLRTLGAAAEPVRVPEGSLASAETFAAFLRSLHSDVSPVWALETGAGVTPTSERGEAIDVRLDWLNASPRLLTSRGRESLNTEPYVFDVRAHVDVEGGSWLPYELLLAPKGFRYDKNLWGRGFNTAVVRESETALRTESAPIFRQPRHVTRITPRASFADLARDPVPVLRSVLTAMEDYLAEWNEAERQFAESPDWLTDFQSEYLADRGQFTSELRRFERGLALIETDPDIQLAFRLTNETFQRGRNTEWRLFQLVFLITQIAAFASDGTAGGDGDDSVPDESEIVDIIFFPTGGGKTEAYLATIVFACFYDRLRGRGAGVTAWIRFPLRLLTLQQTQRVADAIGVAELVRREAGDPRLAAGPPMAVGYFVGQDGSPNEIADPALVGRYGARFAPTWSQANDAAARQAWKRLARCPSCRTPTIRLDFDETHGRLIHRCTNQQCAFTGGAIPVYIVDNEIYRYLPSVLVGTIDKLAGVGNQRKMSMLFGKVEGQCQLHGFYFRRCCQSDCRDPARLRPGIPAGLTGPSLFVQDELHLLREGLGTFDGHYETFVQELSRQLGGPTIKVIASSATIEAFHRQVEHLFGRAPGLARIFPGPGPTLQESFYATTLTHPQRLFVGVLPHNKTIFNATLELLELIHRVIGELASLPPGSSNPYDGALAPGSSEWKLALDSYATSLTYFLNKRQLDSIRTDVEGDLNPNLRSDGLAELEVLELTSGVGTDEVERTLEHIERSRADGELHPDAVLATSMVSHGVDVDRLNVMLFYGMPRQTSEYIQASSRVGRAHCGVVFVGLHPARERDQSHYQYFLKYHEFLGQLVEPVAINRWAAFAMDRTLPGLFMGVLLQMLATASPGNPNQFYMLDAIKRKIATAEISTSDFVPVLEAAYYGKSAPETTAKLEFEVRRYFDQILNAPGSVNFTSEALVPQPMSSLREVDDQIEIVFDPAATVWASRTSSGSSRGAG